MDDLVAFLRGRLAEDEHVAIAAHAYDIEADEEDLAPRSVVVEPVYRDYVDHFTPRRLREDIAAKRRLLEEIAHYEPGDEGFAEFRVAVQLAALPYADHKDYRAEWRPLY